MDDTTDSDFTKRVNSNDLNETLRLKSKAFCVLNAEIVMDYFFFGQVQA